MLKINSQFFISAWLFDVYPSDHGVALWFIDRTGNRLRVFRQFTPYFFLHLNASDTKRAVALGARCPIPVSFTPTTRTEIYSGDSIDVLQVFIHDPMKLREAVWYFEKFFPHFAFFNSDVSVEQQFLYETQLFPLALGDYEISSDGELLSWHLNDDREAPEYELPPFSIIQIRNSNDFVPPKYQKFLQLEISYDNRTYALEQDSPKELLDALNWHLYRCDPDILVTDYGDAILLPKLFALSRQFNIPLLLNRDTSAKFGTTKESSFFQYGKIVHTDGAFTLAGRWHVDAHNSFTVAEADLDGLFEMTRLTQMCGQRQARASIGTSMSSMQLSWAYRNNVLIPSKKREPEEFKSAATLLLADRGGLIFNPPLGYHEDVAELDFASMYPSIMVNNNVSPETINCRCCKNDAVPELGYTICEKRKGVVPETLRAVVKKRAYYKMMKKQYKGKDEALFKRYDCRQSALKWMLVSCFGYLGYKNARFGRIEAHESVNAFSRDIILTAKEIAESRSYRLLHGIIDCIWLKKNGATQNDYEELAREISARVGIDISLEGIYNWILFPASKTDPMITTANHYVGWYKYGDSKMRGIEVRRRDMPKLIKNMQKAMLEKMSIARNVEELSALVPELLEVAQGFISLLQSGRANPMELILKRYITHEADEYVNNSISAVVSKMVEEMGVHLSAGESIEFIIIDQSGKKKPEKAKPIALYAFEDGYDIEQYTELALRVVETLLLPVGYDIDRLKAHFDINQPKQKRLPRRPKNQELPLFRIEI
ncbi:MAG: DNA polymerase domain-containing protein [Bacteroidota bacterium]|jgi:DNA polymerase-2